MRRFASGSLRATASRRERVVLTVGGLQGFVFYAAEQLARRPGRVLVEAPSYDRPLKVLAREGAEIVALPMDDEGLDPDALDAELAQRPNRRRSSTRSRRSRTRAGGRSRPSGARGSSRSSASTSSPCSRTTRTASCASRERRRRACSSSRAASSSRTRRRSRRRSLRACAPATSSSRTPTAPDFEERAVSTYISPPFLARGDRVGVHPPRSLRAEPRARAGRAAGAPRRDARRARAHFPADRRWSTPEGGYFVWLDLDGADTSELARRAEEEGVAFVPGAGFFPRGSGHGGERGSPGVQLRDAGAHRRGDRAAARSLR